MQPTDEKKAAYEHLEKSKAYLDTYETKIVKAFIAGINWADHRAMKIEIESDTMLKQCVEID